MKSSNEELLSMNEELQSANEELETSKEEIQSANDALARANSDLENLLTSTRIATVFLDDDLRIRRFTPDMAAVYNVIPQDVGRPLSDLTHKARAMPPLPAPKDLRQAGRAAEAEVATADGRWYIRRALPYRTHQGTEEGMVVTFSDVTALKATEARLHDLAELLQHRPRPGPRPGRPDRLLGPRGRTAVRVHGRRGRRPGQPRAAPDPVPAAAARPARGAAGGRPVAGGDDPPAQGRVGH